MVKAYVRAAVRWLMAAGMVAVGLAHFLDPGPFVKIMPRALPWPEALVIISGAFEILGGLGLIPKRSRALAGWGLIALYVAVFPANINMAVNEIQIGNTPLPIWALYARLPLQLVLIAAAWWVSRPEVERTKDRQTPGSV